ncbi:hypothetical protein HanRHA438_Chr02g0059071 [Helianthus annuus]|uniref:Uncharacterized protein n=1 Tax=Helianthus annuus TaxID=4232 RepID=A0A251VE49_HELAN|nr:hypothetical protein HanRHA438_Chr02g0059071 [Helianthus annuus]
MESQYRSLYCDSKSSSDGKKPVQLQVVCSLQSATQEFRGHLELKFANQLKDGSMADNPGLFYWLLCR